MNTESILFAEKIARIIYVILCIIGIIYFFYYINKKHGFTKRDSGNYEFSILMTVCILPIIGVLTFDCIIPYFPILLSFFIITILIYSLIEKISRNRVLLTIIFIIIAGGYGVLSYVSTPIKIEIEKINNEIFLREVSEVDNNLQEIKSKNFEGFDSIIYGSSDQKKLILHNKLSLYFENYIVPDNGDYIESWEYSFCRHLKTIQIISLIDSKWEESIYFKILEDFNNEIVYNPFERKIYNNCKRIIESSKFIKNNQINKLSYDELITVEVHILTKIKKYDVDIYKSLESCKPFDSIQTSLDSIRYVMYINYSEEFVGTYTGGYYEGYYFHKNVYIIDLVTEEIVIKKFFQGLPPPREITVNQYSLKKHYGIQSDEFNKWQETFFY